jgi:glycosyltransferase involved in cell wall biosynthesis
MATVGLVMLRPWHSCFVIGCPFRLSCLHKERGSGRQHPNAIVTPFVFQATTTLHPVRLLIVSHSCVTPINQQIYAEIRKLTGWDFTLLVPETWKDEFGNVIQATNWPGFDVNLIKVPVHRTGNIIFHAYRISLKRLLSEGRYDVIYVNHEPYGVATAQLCWGNYRYSRVPFGFYSAQNIRKDYPPPFGWLERAVYRSSRFAFPVTEAVAEVLRSKGYKGDLIVCPLPFDPQLYYPYPKDETPPILQKTGKELLIGYVGRIVEAKGLRTLVKALEQLPRADWKLAVVGTGPFDSEFTELIKSSDLMGQVLRLGFVPHIETPRYLAAFDLLVLPSETQPNWKEQFGRVLIEALACGTPVIGSDSGEIPNLVSSSGGGLVFHERNAEALADALKRMIKDRNLREICADKGRQWALKNVSLQAVGAKMAEAIERAFK